MIDVERAIETRCPHCGHLQWRGRLVVGALETKCQRCKQLIQFATM